MKKIYKTLNFVIVELAIVFAGINLALYFEKMSSSSILFKTISNPITSIVVLIFAFLVKYWDR